MGTTKKFAHDAASHGSDAAATRRRIDSRELLGHGNQLLISHGTEEYCLRLTRQGKLILTK